MSISRLWLPGRILSPKPKFPSRWASLPLNHSVPPFTFQLDLPPPAPSSKYPGPWRDPMFPSFCQSSNESIPTSVPLAFLLLPLLWAFQDLLRLQFSTNEGNHLPCSSTSLSLPLPSTNLLLSLCLPPLCTFLQVPLSRCSTLFFFPPLTQSPAVEISTSAVAPSPFFLAPFPFSFHLFL